MHDVFVVINELNFTDCDKEIVILPICQCNISLFITIITANPLNVTLKSQPYCKEKKKRLNFHTGFANMSDFIESEAEESEEEFEEKDLKPKKTQKFMEDDGKMLPT